MYAQVIHVRSSADTRERAEAIATERMIPALQLEPGFSGAIHLVERETGDAMILVLWEYEQQARRPLLEFGDGFLDALALVAALSNRARQPIAVYAVNALHWLEPAATA